MDVNAKLKLLTTATKSKVLSAAEAMRKAEAASKFKVMSQSEIMATLNKLKM